MVGQALKDRRKVENSRKRATQPGTPLAPAGEMGFILKCGGTPDDRFRAWSAETDCGGVARTVVRPGGCAARASSEPEALATVFLLRCKR